MKQIMERCIYEYADTQIGYTPIWLKNRLRLRPRPRKGQGKQQDYPYDLIKW
jgi:hypothetical protein